MSGAIVRKAAAIFCARPASRFSKKEVSYHSLLAPRAFMTLGERLGLVRGEPKGIGQWPHGRGITRVASGAMALDNRLSELFSKWGWSIPGLSYWALCQKKRSS